MNFDILFSNNGTQRVINKRFDLGPTLSFYRKFTNLRQE